jgi:hypothetical protein
MVHIFFDDDLSKSTHAQRLRRRSDCHRRHEHLRCTPLLPVTFAPGSHVKHNGLLQHLDLEREATLPRVLQSTARFSGVVRACVCQYRDLDSDILRREMRGLAISVLSRRSVVAQSFKVCLPLVGIPLFLVL